MGKCSQSPSVAQQVESFTKDFEDVFKAPQTAEGEQSLVNWIAKEMTLNPADGAHRWVVTEISS